MTSSLVSLSHNTQLYDLSSAFYLLMVFWPDLFLLLLPLGYNGSRYNFIIGSHRAEKIIFITFRSNTSYWKVPLIGFPLTSLWVVLIQTIFSEKNGPYKNRCCRCRLYLLPPQILTCLEVSDQMRPNGVCSCESRCRSVVLHKPTVWAHRTSSFSCDKQVLGNFMTRGADAAEAQRGCGHEMGFNRRN